MPMQKRLFVALDLPDFVKTELTALCTGLPEVRWTPPEQLHLTLAFIGEVDGNTFLDIREALAEIEAPVFSLSLSGLGFFPPRGAPRVLWAGVAANPALNQMQKKVVSCLHRSGMTLEKRKFSPHITLARLHEANSKLERWLAARALLRLGPFPVESFALYSSILGRKGATHILEAEYDLADAPEVVAERGHKKSGSNPKIEAAVCSGGDERNRTAE